MVPTLIDGETVVPESNVINEYLDERFPDPPLKPADPFGRARMRLWTKQLDEGVHDAGIAVLSFGVAFRHQYISKGEAGPLDGAPLGIMDLFCTQGVESTAG